MEPKYKQIENVFKKYINVYEKDSKDYEKITYEGSCSLVDMLISLGLSNDTTKTIEQIAEYSEEAEITYAEYSGYSSNKDIPENGKKSIEKIQSILYYSIKNYFEPDNKEYVDKLKELKS